MFLLPGMPIIDTRLYASNALITSLGRETPHNLVSRFANTTGLVMERVRPEDRSTKKLRWYCKKGDHPTPTVIHEEQFHCTDLGTQLEAAYQQLAREC